MLIGTYFELYIVQNLGICGGQYAENIKKLILAVLGEVPAFSEIEKAAEVAVHDKKNVDSLISLIAPKREGECSEIKLSLADYKKYLKACSDSLRWQK